MPTVACPTCGHKGAVAFNQLAGVVTCPKCHGRFSPTAGPVPSAEQDPDTKAAEGYGGPGLGAEDADDGAKRGMPVALLAAIGVSAAILLALLLWLLVPRTAVTKAQYDQLTECMSYAEVASVMRSEGKELADFNFGPSAVSRACQWENADGSCANVA